LIREDKLFDPIRKIFVPAHPEEKIRQNLLSKMIHKLGYPPSLLAVEKDLKHLPHIKDRSFSANKRRADIICFGKNIHPTFELYPLLMIECKAHKLSDPVVEQVVGYNHYVQAYFICVANGFEIKTLWFDKGIKKTKSVNYLPTYNQLMSSI